MLNLINSLNLTFLALFYDKFYHTYKLIVNFYTIHDFFITISNKVDILINIFKII